MELTVNFVHKLLTQVLNSDPHLSSSAIPPWDVNDLAFKLSWNSVQQIRTFHCVHQISCLSVIVGFVIGAVAPTPAI